jgi:hypothetical protein
MFGLISSLQTAAGQTVEMYGAVVNAQVYTEWSQIVERLISPEGISANPASTI